MIGIRVVTAAVVAAGVVAGPASASSPEENGRIVFNSNRSGLEEIYSIQPDGTDLRRLTWNAANDFGPRLAADGRQIAFSRIVGVDDSDVWIMSADGSDERPLTTGPASDAAPVFTHDGEHVVFQRSFGASGCPCGVELWIVRSDGSGARKLETGFELALSPDVSKNGKLAFVGNVDGTRSIYVTDLRGGPVKRVTDGSAFGEFSPRWSPSGNDLVFVRAEGASPTTRDVWRVHKNGSDLRRLTSDARLEQLPDWSPDGERIVMGFRDTAAPFGGWLTTIDADSGGDDQLVPRFALPFTDAFDDGRTDTSFWFAGATGTDTSIAEANGRIEVMVGGAAAPGGTFLDAQQWFRCSGPGDFDVSVGYELLEWPAANFVQVALSAHFAGNLFVHRWNNAGGEHYVGHTPSVAASIRTTDMAGRLRLVRQDGIATALVREGAEWRALASSPSSGNATFAIQAFSAVSLFGGRPARIAFDDFRLDAGELSCPPNWRDAAADWAAAG